MWLCPSRGRPENLKRLALSWKKTASEKARLEVRLDEDDLSLKDYLTSHWPASWTLHVGPSLLGAAGAMKWAFEKFPDEIIYGFIGDDVILYTPNWDSVLSLEAGDWNVAYPDDGFQRSNLATFPCAGGNFIRALGYWALPNLSHFYVDTVLHVLAKETKKLRYCPQVLFEHMHPAADKAPDDLTYQRVEGKWQSDTKIYNQWILTNLASDIKRIINARRKT